MKKLMIALLIGLASIAAADMVYLKGQAKGMEVEIVKDSWNEVVYAYEGNPITVAWNRIDRIEYKGMKGTVWEMAETIFNRGNFAEAAEKYEQALRDLRTKYKWITPYATYKAGVCYFNLGEFEKAARFFEFAVREKDSHFEPDAYRMAGLCYLKLEQFDKAKEWLNKITAVYGESRQAAAQAMMVDIEFQAGDFAGAETKFRKLRDKIRDKLDLTGLGLDVKIGVCMVRKGDISGGRAVLEKAIAGLVESLKRRLNETADVEPVLAEAYTALGNSFLAADPKDYSLAGRAFLHAAVTYNRVQNPAVAEGALRAAECFIELLKTMTDTEIRPQMIQKTGELLNTAKRMYGGNTSVIRKINQYLKEMPTK